MEEFQDWRRSPGGIKISTGRGERAAAWLRRRMDRRFAVGVSARPVSYADHRSGWSAVVMEVSLGWWGVCWTLLRWRSRPYKEYRTISLAEQIRRDHPTGPTLEEQERLEDEEKADERARLALFDKMLKEHDARNDNRV